MMNVIFQNIAKEIMVVSIYRYLGNHDSGRGLMHIFFNVLCPQDYHVQNGVTCGEHDVSIIVQD